MLFLKEFAKAGWPAKAGMAMILVYLFCAVFAPLIAPYAETEVIITAPWASAEESGTLLGLDQLGRDLWTRVLYGARNTITIAIVITLLAFFIGMAAGFFAAVVGGVTDQLLSRIVDIIMAFPTLFFALIVLSILGTSVPVLIVVIAILDSTRVFRISRALAMDISVMDYVEVAKLRGEGLWWIMRREVLPNALTPLIAEFGLRFCFVFLFISALSFLGLGIQPPAADWGSMVRENAAAITYGIMTPLVPALAIAILTIAVNLVVDWFLRKTSGLRDEV
ncbi:MAG: ABC transporter permease [Gammaproteobacteria bacterium]|nr:ABC transporter permease [Gammaproteobacteria bacterium]